jgi:hypothetical protein
MSLIVNKLKSLIVYLKRGLAFVGFNTPPSVFIVGAQKAGTTSLHDYLSEHPQIQSGLLKEVRYYSVDNNYAKGNRWYHSFFPYAGNKKSLDATPEYLYYPYVAQRLYDYNPNAKIIIVLRNPIDRAYSAWNMYRQFGEEKSSFNSNFLDALKIRQPEEFNYFYASSFPSFETVVRKGIETISKGEKDYFGILSRGFYLNQINEYWKHFNPEQIKIIETEDLKGKNDIVMSELTRFLDVSTIKWQKMLEKSEGNVRKYNAPMDSNTRELLLKLYENTNHELYTKLNKHINWQ